MKSSKIRQYSTTPSSQSQSKKVKRSLEIESVESEFPCSSSSFRKSENGEKTTKKVIASRASLSPVKVSSKNSLIRDSFNRDFSLTNRSLSKSYTTVIEKVSESQPTMQPSQESADQICVLFFPLLLDSCYKQIKILIFFKVNNSQFLEFGFNLPFSNYFDSSENLFEIDLGPNSYIGQIVATGGEFSRKFPC